MNFTRITDLPILDLYSELNSLIDNDTVQFSTLHNQICINTIKGQENNIYLGAGSLSEDWDNKVETESGYIVAKKDKQLHESEFKVLCNQFKDTLFEDVYNLLNKKYFLGRVRIMRSKGKTCLSWHRDSSRRLHYPLKTQEGCFMVIEDEVKFLPANEWWLTNTRKFHSAFNGSLEERIHLVACVLGER